MLNYYILGDSSTMNSLTASIPPFLSVEFLGSSTDIGTAYSQILTKKPDVVFIDEDLIQVSEEGLSMLREASMLIFTSGKRAPDVKMRFYNPASCTLSNSANVNHTELISEKKQAEDNKKRLRSYTGEGKDYIIIKTRSQSTAGKVTVKIKFTDIIYIESSRNYVQIHTEDSKNFTAHVHLKTIESKLPAGFERVNKAYLINFDKITSIEGRDHIVLNNNLKNPIPIGRTYRQRVVKWKKQYRSSLLEKSKAGILGVLPYLMFSLSNWCEFY